MSGDERNLWWRIGAPLVWPIERAIFRVRIEGVENIPASGPGVLAFNHVSVLDGPCLAIETSLRSRREVRFLVAAELFGLFFFGWVMRCFDQIPIRRGQRDATALHEAIATVREGALAAIAPEGRVSEDPALGLQRIRSGVARVAMPTGAPVIPVGIWGTQRRWPRDGLKRARLWRRETVAIVYGPPISALGDPDEPEVIDAFREELSVALTAAVTRAKAIAGTKAGTKTGKRP